MSELERLEELRKVLQDEYATAKKEYDSAVIEGRDAAKNYFFGVMTTLEHVFSYVKILANSKISSNKKELIDSVYCIESPRDGRFMLDLYTLGGDMIEYEVTERFHKAFTKYFVGF